MEQTDRAKQYVQLWSQLETLLNAGYVLSDSLVVRVSDALDRLVLEDMRGPADQGPQPTIGVKLLEERGACSGRRVFRRPLG
ncbi:MAG: hypothetical protein OWU32_00385 [Firmicutes bacterium]|nr:hypothetical protein [Bacillota bacterium]